MPGAHIMFQQQTGKKSKDARSHFSTILATSAVSDIIVA
jgi:hypothetical protein